MTKRSVIWVLIMVFIVIGAIIALVIFSNTSNLGVTSSEASLVNKIYFRRDNPYSATVNKNSKFKLYIDAGILDGATSPTLASLIIKYNPELIEAIAVSGNENYTSSNKKIDNVEGLVTINIDSTSGFSVDKNLGSIEFKVKTITLQDVLISLEKGSTFGNPNTLDISSGMIYILLNAEFTCPLFTSPEPGWCKATEIFGGYSQRGCPLPPRCVDSSGNDLPISYF